MKNLFTIISSLLLCCATATHTKAQDKPQPTPSGDAGAQRSPLQVGGAFPELAIVGDHIDRSEMGIGALLPWADRLWMISYVAHIRGTGGGLYELDEKMQMRKHPQSVTGTFANRMVHNASNQAFIGPHVIDIKGQVRTIPTLSKLRLTATMDHLTDPKNKVYFLTMEGLFFEVDVNTLEAVQLFDLVRELDIPKTAQVHFKGAYTASGRVVVANNSYYEGDFLGTQEAGRLAEWDGKRWTILEKKPFVEVSGKNFTNSTYGSPIYATGWDRASAILKVYAQGKWNTYRLPKASQTFDHAWNTEWMRIREAQTERYIMDVHGLFYDLPTLNYGGKTWGVKPIAQHLRLVPDFCYWRGVLVMAGDQTDRAVGQPQSGLWFGQIDDLWKMGKPTGWGGPWWKDDVKAQVASDPYLMTGFDQKVVHLSHTAPEEVEFKIEVDFLGDGSWQTYSTIKVSANGYAHHEFPAAYSAHWVRVTPNKNCNATVYFIYT